MALTYILIDLSNMHLSDNSVREKGVKYFIQYIFSWWTANLVV